ILTNTAGDGISVVNDAEGRTSTISVKLKDGEQNLVVDKDGLSLKPEITLDKVTSDNFTVDGTNISLTNAGLVMGDTTKLTSDGLTTGKVTVGNIVLDSTTNKITGLEAGNDPTDAVNKSQLDNVEKQILTNTAGDGISVVNDAEGRTSTISVKLKDGEQNLAVDKDGLSLKPEITLDKVTSDNFTVDGTNISLTSAGLVMGDTTKLTSGGLTTGKVSVGSIVLDSTTNKITGLVTDGSNGSEAVSVDYLKDYVSTAGVGKVYTEGNGISIVEGIDNNPSTISVKLKDGEQNLVVDKDGLSLKPEITLDKVTSDNFTVDGTNISLTNAGLVMGDTTKLTSDGLTTGKVTVGNIVLDSTTNKITGLEAGNDPTDAVNKSQLDNVEKQILTNTAGDGISVVNDAEGRTSTISVKLKDGEQNLAVDKDGLSLKPEITLDKVTSDNFTVDGTNISLTTDGLKIDENTSLTSTGLTTPKGIFNTSVTVGNGDTTISIESGSITGLSTPDGRDESAAVNVGYLNNYIDTDAGLAVQYDGASKKTVTLGDEDGGVQTLITNLAEGDINNANSTDAVRGSQLYATNQIVGDGKYTSHNYLINQSADNGMNLTEAVSALDFTIGNLTFSQQNVLKGKQGSVTNALSLLNEAVGAVNFDTGVTFVGKGSDLTNAVRVLDSAISNMAKAVGVRETEGGGLSMEINWDGFSQHSSSIIDTLRMWDTNLYASDNLSSIDWSGTKISEHASIVTGMKELDGRVTQLENKISGNSIGADESSTNDVKAQESSSAEGALAETTATEAPTAPTMESAMAKAPAAANSMLTSAQPMTMALNAPAPLANGDPSPVENPNPDGSNTSNIHTEGDMTTVEKDFTVTGDATFEQGASMGGHKITDVAAGTEDTDGVNYGQLKEVQNQVDANSQNIGILGSAVNKLGDRIERVGAGAAALAALHPLDFDPDNKLDFAAGFGNYRGASAVAVGAFYRPSENVMFSVGGAFGGGEDMVNAGVSFKVGAGSGSATTSRTAMAKSLKSMQEVVASQDAQLAQQREQIDKLTAMVELLMEQNGQAQPKDGDAQAGQPQQ
ncbi:YadA-like family protein, partial [Megasphaera stantonii]|uniref:YadA-like family protein n=1 Tax=Megasphaera stantonii TaxID=2144175 RepID=UPI0029421665